MWVLCRSDVIVVVNKASTMSSYVKHADNPNRSLQLFVSTSAWHTSFDLVKLN